MSFKYMVFSILFFLIVLFLGVKNYDTWTHPPELSPGRRMEKKMETKLEGVPVMTDAKAPSIASYVSIAEKNIFSPERKEFPLPILAASKKPSGRPPVILYGVTILEDRQYASVVNPGRPLKKGEREMITLKRGEQIGEYQLVEILPDRIRLEASGDSFEVLLYDPAIPKKRSDTKTAAKKPAAITSTGPAASSVEASKPVPLPVLSPVPAEKPRVPSPEAVSPTPSRPPMAPTPPPTSSPNTPTVYPGRSRRVPSPPQRTPVQQGGS